jgi:hypothetical protein
VHFVAIARQQQAPAWMGVPGESDQTHGEAAMVNMPAIVGDAPRLGQPWPASR